MSLIRKIEGTARIYLHSLSESLSGHEHGEIPCNEELRIYRAGQVHRRAIAREWDVPRYLERLACVAGGITPIGLMMVAIYEGVHAL